MLANLSPAPLPKGDGDIFQGQVRSHLSGGSRVGAIVEAEEEVVDAVGGGGAINGPWITEKAKSRKRTLSLHCGLGGLRLSSSEGTFIGMPKEECLWEQQ